MSLVDFGAPAATAGFASGAAAPLAVWARAAARISLVDFGAAEGTAAVGAAGAAVGSVAAGAALAAGSATGCGAAAAGSPLWPDSARAAFKMSAVESFFAITVFQRSQTGDGLRRTELNSAVDAREQIPPAKRVRFADSVSAFECCPLCGERDKEISQKQEIRKCAISQR
jgi:hypothetical protein